MSLRTWLQKFVALGGLAWSLNAIETASAQPPAPAAPPAAVADDAPRVNVDIPEPAPTSLAPNFDPFPRDTVLNNNPFAPPPVTGYRSGSATTGSIINMPAMAYPGTVNTITRDMRRDQQVINTDDLIRDIGGAVKATGNGGDGVRRPDQFLMRGFEMTAQNFRKNGFLDPTYTPRDYANVERIDVLKGPAAVVYGSMQPAGTFNIITKKAQQGTFNYGAFTAGSFGLERYEFDVNNSNRSGDVLFRINGAYTNQSSSFRDYGFMERTFVSPTATLLLTERTSITAEAEVNNSRRLYDTGLVAINGNTAALPINRFLGDPNDYFKNHDYRGTLSLTHLINDDWTFYMGGSTLFFDFQNQGTQPQTGIPGVAVDPTTGFYNGAGNGVFPDLIRTRFLGGQQGYSHSLMANVNGKYNGPLFRHNVVLGTEEVWLMNKANFPTSYPPAGDSLLLIDPTSGGPFPGATTTSFDYQFGGDYQRRQSVYFQDLVEVTDRLKAMYGVRWDHIDQTFNTTLVINGIGPIFNNFYKQSYNQGTPRVGLTYDLVPEQVTLYGMFTSAFNPMYGIFGTPGPGANRNPELAQIWETGVKMQLRDNLMYTFGVFNIDRENVAVQANSNPGSTYFQANQRSKGIEMNLIGNWTDRLSTVSNYSYTDAKQQDPNAALGYENISGRIRGVPFNLANVWTRYNLIQDRNRTLGLGLGYVYVGDRRGAYGDAGGLPVPLVLPSYNRWDLGVFGRVGPWNMTTYIENIFDTRYVAGSTSQYQIYPGAPVNVRFQVGVNF